MIDEKSVSYAYKELAPLVVWVYWKLQEVLRELLKTTWQRVVVHKNKLRFCERTVVAQLYVWASYKPVFPQFQPKVEPKVDECSFHPQMVYRYQVVETFCGYGWYRYQYGELVEQQKSLLPKTLQVQNV